MAIATTAVLTCEAPRVAQAETADRGFASGLSAPLPAAESGDDRLVLARAMAAQALQKQRTAQRAARAARRKELAAERLARERANAWAAPITAAYRFTSGYGYRWGRLHAGTDLAAPIGTRIRALFAGTVILASTSGGYGLKVEIRHADGTVSWYAHMSSIAVRVGQRVERGAKIGEVGSTGSSTGPHLHLELHPGGGPSPTNPLPVLATHGVRLA